MWKLRWLHFESARWILIYFLPHRTNGAMPSWIRWTSPEKRVALLTKQVDMANDILKIVQARFEAGTVTELDICRVKSLHLGLKDQVAARKGWEETA